MKESNLVQEDSKQISYAWYIIFALLGIIYFMAKKMSGMLKARIHEEKDYQARLQSLEALAKSREEAHARALEEIEQKKIEISEKEKAFDERLEDLITKEQNLQNIIKQEVESKLAELAHEISEKEAKLKELDKSLLPLEKWKLAIEKEAFEEMSQVREALQDLREKKNKIQADILRQEERRLETQNQIVALRSEWEQSRAQRQSQSIMENFLSRLTHVQETFLAQPRVNVGTLNYVQGSVGNNSVVGNNSQANHSPSLTRYEQCDYSQNDRRVITSTDNRSYNDRRSYNRYNLRFLFQSSPSSIQTEESPSLRNRLQNSGPSSS